MIRERDSLKRYIVTSDFRFNDSTIHGLTAKPFVIRAFVQFVSVRVVQFRVQPYLGKFPVTPHRYT